MIDMVRAAGCRWRVNHPPDAGRGSVKVMVVPTPGWLDALMRPPCAAIIPLAIVNPSPDPREVDPL